MDKKRRALYSLAAMTLAGAAAYGAGFPLSDVSDAPVVIKRRDPKLTHVPVPNPRAEERKRRAVAEMQARKARKRAKSALSRAE